MIQVNPVAMERPVLYLFAIALLLFAGSAIGLSPQEKVLASGEQGQAVYILETGDDALLARVHLIRAAQRSVDIQTFIWANDHSGRFVMFELIEAARRGVAVRLLVDDLSARKSAFHVAALAKLHPNLRIKQYNPLSENMQAGLVDRLGSYAFEFGQVNQRMHNKTLLVDGKYAITGGRNYADDYFDRGANRSFKDRDLLVVGPVVRDMVDSFEAYWAFELSVDSSLLKGFGELSKSVPEDMRQYQVPKIFADLSQCASDQNCFFRRVLSEPFRVEDIEFIADIPGKKSDGDYSVTAASLLSLFESAAHTVVMQTPYLVVGSRGGRLFKGIRRKRPELDVIVSTNSLAAADHFYAYAFSYKNKRRYLKDFRWQIFELKPSPRDIDSIVPVISGVHRSSDHYVCIHSKTFVFDNEVAWVGSYNLDPRSASLNTEAGLLIRDSALASRLAKTIRRETSPDNSWTVGVRRKVPVLKWVNGLIEETSSRLPFMNVWPFTYSTSFELREDREPVPYFHPDFYQRYRSVGQFPGSHLGDKAIKTRLTKAFFGPAEPII
jgi:phosphatidylserine/phosphatidylglycerophosphate/cardiolipin synthase-like enzyme